MFEFLKNIDWTDNKTKICVSLVSLLVLILVSIGFINIFNKDNKEEIKEEIVVEEQVSNPLEVTYTETEVMKVIQGNNVYTVIRKTPNVSYEFVSHYINYNGSYYGESNFNISMEPYDLILFDGVVTNNQLISSNKSSSGSSIENGLVENPVIEETEEDNDVIKEEVLQSGIDFLSISDKAVSEELIYRLDRSTIINFINTLLNNGYEINTQIATNTYNELYLENKMESHFYRVIILNGQNLMIISEIDNLSGLDINKIMQKK